MTPDPAAYPPGSSWRTLRIALCGHETEHDELEAIGWTVETWEKVGGYQGKDDRERIWFSPHCLGRATADQLEMGL